MDSSSPSSLSRRTFAKTLGMAACVSVPAWAAPAHRLRRIGFIAGIVSKEMKHDWRATLQRAAGYGFSEIETGRHFGDSAPGFVDYCQQIGLKTIGGGVPLSADNEKLKPQLDQLNGLGATYAAVYWPWLVGGPFSLSDCQRSADLLNSMGETCRQHGLTLCWHNHDKEFIPMETGLPFDYLMAHTDPQLVKCEMDVYWVAKGGANPVALLQKHTGRYAILHVKDMAAGTAEAIECPGSGILGFPAILAEAHRQGIGHFMVEQDNTTDGLACLQASGRYLRQLRF